jgi:hypothetical protein
MLWRINYNNFAHTAHHIRRVYLLRRANTFLFFRYENNEICDFFLGKKKKKEPN